MVSTHDYLVEKVPIFSETVPVLEAGVEVGVSITTNAFPDFPFTRIGRL
jgi:hypothetical protein